MTKDEEEMYRLLENIKIELKFREDNKKAITELLDKVEDLRKHNAQSVVRENESRSELLKATEQYAKGIW